MSAIRELFYLAGGPGATDEQVDQVRQRYPDLWKAVLSELTDASVHDALSKPRFGNPNRAALDEVRRRERGTSR